MPNNFFSFKQFRIDQDQCSMKVCTDACIFGAWTAQQLQDTTGNILDIGCGTGLLSLMLAQKTNAIITAIEIDSNAAEQARENISRSSWKERISVMNIPLQQFNASGDYECIICNPPFFEDDLKSPDETKNRAKHDNTLKLEELVAFIKKHLNDEGSAFVLLPFHRTKYFSELLQKNNLHVKECLFLKQSPAHPYFRSVLVFSHKAIQPVESNELTIHDGQRNYTEAFKMLLNDYYLKL